MTSPLEVALRSPARVLEKDKAGWLALFTEDAIVEDPVGAGVHAGKQALSRFWDVFIQPQVSVRFTGRRDFEGPGQALRYVTISSVTPVSDTPFELSALVHYRVEGERVASLRAFWEPHQAVSWHARQGLSGLGGLLKHGARTTRGLGLGAATKFGLAMRGGVTKKRADQLASALAAASGGAPWRDGFERAECTVTDASGASRTGLDGVEEALAGDGAMQVEETIVAGDWVACVLSGADRSAAALVHVQGGQVRSLELIAQRR
ncbi:MAG: nuclear transport factor 2 family protein [Sandaracinaceae bacterium]